LLSPSPSSQAFPLEFLPERPPLPASPDHGYRKMMQERSALRGRGKPLVLIASYVFDWIILAALAAAGVVMDRVSPNKRPFSLNDPNIS